MVYKINRSHRMAYMLELFPLAVVLTTALLLAREGDAQSQEKKVFEQSFHSRYSAAIEKGDWGCAAA